MEYIYKRTLITNFLLILILMLATTVSLSAQKEPQYTQYMYNIGSFNPAYVGTVEKPDISGLYRAQWINIPGAPRTIRFGLNYPLTEQHGLGFNVVNDQVGPTSNTYVDASYSYRINVAEDAWLSFGMDAGGSFLNVDFSKGSFENPGEPILDRESINQFYPIIGAGLFLYQQHWYLGVSVPNFLTDGLYNEEVATIVDDKTQFNFIGGYVFDLSDELKMKPAVLASYVSGAPLTFNLSANFLINDVFTAGASYRLDNAVSGLAGFQVNDATFIGYSYDYSTTSLGEYNQGSHEIILKFYLGSGDGQPKDEKSRNRKGKPKQIDTPRFF